KRGAWGAHRGPPCSEMRIVDLSYSIRPHFRWKVAPQLVASHAEGHPLQSTLLTIGCHAYTHVDAPLHFLVDGRAGPSMPVDQWGGGGGVVDLTHLGANGEVTAADLDRRAGHVRAGDIVLLRTDWPKRTSIADEAFWKQGPWTGPSACKWLVDRTVKAVGYDYPPDHCIPDTVAEPRRRPARDEYTTHAIFFPAGIPVIEDLTNLDQIGVPRCRFMA